MSNKILLGAVVFLAACMALYVYVGNQVAETNTLSSATGTTFSTEKQAMTVISLATPGANGTSTSMLNSDAYDRYVTATKIGCSGVGTSLTAYTGTGLASLQVTVGTSSAAAPAAAITPFAKLVNAQALSTTTSNLLVASSTLLTATSSWPSIWHSGEYMTFQFNATNTAVCTIGVNYFGS